MPDKEKNRDWRLVTCSQEIGDYFSNLQYFGLAQYQSPISNLQSLIPLFFITLLPLLLIGCQTSETAVAVQPAENDIVTQIEAGVASTLTAMPTPTLQATATLPPPPTSSVNIASFNLVDPDKLPTETAVPTSTPKTPIETPISAASEPTETPMPTFTPPALPQTSLDEHYWLRRPVAEGGVVWTDKTYPYGSTRGGELRPHHGVEFAIDYDTEVLATASGTVVVAGRDDTVMYGPELNFYGKLVVVELDSKYNGQPVYTLYGHINEALVTVGQRVDAQQIIALSGASGVADGPHVHLEVRIGANDYNSTRNPLLWLWPFPDRGTVIGRVTFPDGSLAYEAPVRVVRVDAPSRYAATTTYARGRTNPDDEWYENFAIDDVEAGYYELIVAVGDEKYTENVWVYPRRTTFVEIEIGK